MRLGILSDTHGQIALTRNAIRMLESLDVETVLHCGVEHRFHIEAFQHANGVTRESDLAVGVA